MPYKVQLSREDGDSGGGRGRTLEQTQSGANKTVHGGVEGGRSQRGTRSRSGNVGTRSRSADVQPGRRPMLGVEKGRSHGREGLTSS